MNNRADIGDDKLRHRNRIKTSTVEDERIGEEILHLLEHVLPSALDELSNFIGCIQANSLFIVCWAKVC